MDNKKWTDEDLEAAFRNSSKLETFEDLKDFLLKRRQYANAIESNCTIDSVSKRKPIRYKCLLCGRDKFIKKHHINV